MADFPVYRMPPPPILTTHHPDAVGFAVSTSTATMMGGATSVVWDTANNAYYFPFRLYDWATAYQLLFWVGATSDGNIDMAIYDAQLNRIVTAGSTAMSATVNTVQELNITDTILAPGDYLLAVACSSGLGTTFVSVNTADEIALATFPVYMQASAFPLPDPAVPVVSTVASPMRIVCGIQFRSVF